MVYPFGFYMEEYSVSICFMWSRCTFFGIVAEFYCYYVDTCLFCSYLFSICIYFPFSFSPLPPSAKLSIIVPTDINNMETFLQKWWVETMHKHIFRRYEYILFFVSFPLFILFCYFSPFHLLHTSAVGLRARNSLVACHLILFLFSCVWVGVVVLCLLYQHLN